MDTKNEGNNPNVANDVLHFENHTQLSSEEVAKAMARHNRKHKGDENKQHMQEMKGAGKKKSA